MFPYLYGTYSICSFIVTHICVRSGITNRRNMGTLCMIISIFLYINCSKVKQFLYKIHFPWVTPEKRAGGHSQADSKAATYCRNCWARHPAPRGPLLLGGTPCHIVCSPQLCGLQGRRGCCLPTGSGSWPSSKADLGVPEHPGQIHTSACPWSPRILCVSQSPRLSVRVCCWRHWAHVPTVP